MDDIILEFNSIIIVITKSQTLKFNFFFFIITYHFFNWIF